MRQNEKDMDLRAKIKAMETAEEEDFGSSSISIIRLDWCESYVLQIPTRPDLLEVGFGTLWSTPGPATWPSSWPSSLSP